jgi:serine/threonine protein phosphatase 1
MTTLSFDEPTAAEHRRIDVSDRDRVFVVGDVHGCRNALERLFSTVRVTADDLVVFVGDLVRKGPDSAGVLEFLRSRDNCVSVRGNNEEKLLRGEAALPDLDEDDLSWLRSLPVAVSFERTLVVHGGVDPRRPLADHDVDDLQTTRSLARGGGYDGPFWFERYRGPPRVCFGHTVLETPVDREWAVGLDTGCVYGGDLTALELREERFVAVPGYRPGRDRDAAKIVDPNHVDRAD